MASSSEFDSSILALAAGLFNAPPGFNAVTELRQTFAGGASLREVADNLTRTELFLSQYPAELSSAHFAARFISNLVGNQVSFAVLVLAAVEMARLLEAGMSRADVSLLAITTLQAMPADNPQWRDASAAFANKLEVARYHSIEREGPTTSLDELQKVLTPVTHRPESITTGRLRAEGVFETLRAPAVIEADNSGPAAPSATTLTEADNTLTVTVDEYAALGTLDMAGGVDTLEINDTPGATLDLEQSTVRHVERLLLNSGAGLRQALADLSAWSSLAQVELALGQFNEPQELRLPSGVTQLSLRDSPGLATPRANGMLVTVSASGTGLSSLDAEGLKSGGLTFKADVASGAITVKGSGGVDTVTTGKGDDVFHYSAGKDVLDALGGTDTLVIGEDFLDELASLESTFTGFEQLRLVSGSGLNLNKADVSAFTGFTGFSGVSVELAATPATQTLVLADTMTHVSVNNPGSSTSLQTKGLSTLTLQGGTADSDIQVLHGTAAHALTVRVREHAAGAVITDTNAGLVTVNSLGTKANTVALAMPDATRLDVALDASLTLAATGTDLSALERVNLTGTMAFAADVSGLGSLTQVDASGGSGAHTVTLDPRVTAYAGGAGKDTVTISVAPTRLLDGGAGADDVLNLKGTGLPQANVQGFEKYVLSDPVFTKGNTFLLSESSTVATELVLNNVEGSADKLSIAISGKDAVNIGHFRLDKVEDIVVVSTDTNAVPTGDTLHSLELAADAVKQLTVTGNTSLKLTSQSTTLTSLDARNLKGGGLEFTAAAVAAPLSVRGSPQSDTLDLSLVTGAVSVNISAMNDVITTGSGDDLFILGTGRNEYDGGAGTDTVDVVVAGSADVNYSISKLKNIEALRFKGTSGTFLVDGVSVELVQDNVATLTHMRSATAASYFSLANSSTRTTRFGVGDVALAPATLSLVLQGPSADVGTLAITDFKSMAVDIAGTEIAQTMRMSLNAGVSETLTLTGGNAIFITKVAGGSLRSIDATAFASGSLQLTASNLSGNVELKGGAGNTTFTIASSAGAQVTMLGGDGNDTLNADATVVIARGGKGNDQVAATGPTTATLHGDEGNDTLLVVGAGNVAYGGAGDDLFVIGTKIQASHSLYLGDGNDTVRANMVTSTSKFSTIHDIQPGDQLHVDSTKNNYPETLDLTTVTPLVLGTGATLQNYYDAIFGVAGGVPQWRWFRHSDALYLVYDTDTVTQFTRPDFGIILEGLVDLAGVTYSNDGTYAKFFF